MSTTGGISCPKARLGSALAIYRELIWISGRRMSSRNAEVRTGKVLLPRRAPDQRRIRASGAAKGARAVEEQVSSHVIHGPTEGCGPLLAAACRLARRVPPRATPSRARHPVLHRDVGALQL